jgi:hypothetical protein
VKKMFGLSMHSVLAISLIIVLNMGKPLKMGGYPAQVEDRRVIEMAYVSAIDQIVLKMKLPAGHFFDVVFVDGRYRACCAMYAVLLGYFMIDDYGPGGILMG